MSDLESTCIRNNQPVRCLQLQVYGDAPERGKEQQPMTTTILTVAPRGTWNLDPVHSRVDFEVSYLAGTFKGEFHEIEAGLTVEGESALLVGTTKVASVDVRDENLSAHLQSPD